VLHARGLAEASAELLSDSASRFDRCGASLFASEAIAAAEALA
jgi:hypothetical protein